MQPFWKTTIGKGPSPIPPPKKKKNSQFSRFHPPGHKPYPCEPLLQGRKIVSDRADVLQGGANPKSFFQSKGSSTKLLSACIRLYSCIHCIHKVCNTFYTCSQMHSEFGSTLNFILCRIDTFLPSPSARKLQFIPLLMNCREYGMVDDLDPARLRLLLWVKTLPRNLFGMALFPHFFGSPYFARRLGW